MKTKTSAIAALAAAALLSPLAHANDQKVLDACISSWGTKSPFKKGTAATSVILPMRALSGWLNLTEPTTPIIPGAPDRTALVLVVPAPVIFGQRTTIRLSNPKGWYCVRFDDPGGMGGRIDIEAPCNVQLARAKSDGSAVREVGEIGRETFGMGVTTRVGCGLIVPSYRR